MAYTKTSWADRTVEFPNRYKDQTDTVYTLQRHEGVVSVEGTPFNATTMNNIESGIEANDIAITELETKTQRHITTFAINSAFTITADITYQKPPYTILSQVGDKIGISSNSALIGSGVSKIVLSGKAMWSSPTSTSGNRFLTIYKNGVALYNTSVYVNGTRRDEIVWSSLIIEVEEGDTIDLRVYGYNGDVVDAGAKTYFTIEVIE